MATTSELLKDLTELEEAKAQAQEKMNTSNKKRDAEIQKIQERYEKSSKSAKEELDLILKDIRSKAREYQKAVGGGGTSSESSGNGSGKRQKRTPEQVDAALLKLVQEYPEGITSRHLAEELGISGQSAANKILDALGRDVVKSNGEPKRARRIVATDSPLAVPAEEAVAA